MKTTRPPGPATRAAVLPRGVKTYDLIAVGTGSATNLIDPFLRKNPDARVAIIDKDKPGGICLTRGCIPTKLLTTVADLVRAIERAGEFGIDARIDEVSFERIMARMHAHIDPDIESIGQGLSNHPQIDYFRTAAEFVAPYTLKVGGNRIQSKLFFLCAGSRPIIPTIDGIDKVPYHTTDTILDIKKRPSRLLIVGGGYIAAEFGHFFSAVGSTVTVIGRNAKFLPDEDPDVSALAAVELRKRLDLRTNQEAIRATQRGAEIELTTRDRSTGNESTVRGDLLLIAAGRTSNGNVLKPEAGGIETHGDGWIRVNDYLETNQPGIWAFGDCIGRYQFKHSANYESGIVFQNALFGGRVVPDYHSVPHAVFTDPEIAGVGMTEPEARAAYPVNDLLVGRYRYEDTAKGQALNVQDMFVKVIAHAGTRKILGAHIIGPQASVLVQEIVNVMNVPGGTFDAVTSHMHIHPALSEVVERAVGALRPVEATPHRH